MPRPIHEPILVYLTSEERGLLDRLAGELGVSRSAVLRRGLHKIAEPTEVLVPPKASRGAPPPSRPVAGMDELLDELKRDRDGR